MSEKNEWKLAEALRESLLWTASSLAAVGKEQDVIVLEGRKRTSARSWTRPMRLLTRLPPPL